ncbi:MAG: MopE-related protein, partial [Planctomycetota bacterium]
MTGDGVGDFLAGAKWDDDAASNGGSVLLFSGENCDFVRIYLDPEAGSSDELGISVSWLPDVTGDSIPEVVAGVWRDDTSLGTDAGSVVVFNGATALPEYKLTDPDGRTSDWLGTSVAGIGDVDFDGVADIAAGSQLDDNLLGFDTGSVLVFSGADGSLIRKMTAGSAQDNLGFSVLALDDVNGDGVRDIAAGAPGEDVATTNHGAVVIFSGVDGSVLRTMTDPLFAEASISLGFSLALMSDLTGDGIGEVLAGAYFSDVNGTNSGSAFIFDPTNGTQFRGDELVDPAGAANDQLGIAVGAADVTGDGMAEALVGAYLAESVEEGDVGKVVIFSYESDCDTDGSSPFGDDCDDTDSANYTGNTESCDMQDNDCDTVVDEDDDGDGFGVCDGDCDEANPLIYPGAPELCNGLDDDCNGVVDNGPDTDLDGAVAPCDCDDTDDTIFPGAAEVCNHADENCGEVDEGFAQPLTAQSVQDTVDGRPSDWFGVAVAGIGDVTGDGAE